MASISGSGRTEGLQVGGDLRSPSRRGRETLAERVEAAASVITRIRPPRAPILGRKVSASLPFQPPTLRLGAGPLPHLLREWSRIQCRLTAAEPPEIRHPYFDAHSAEGGEEAETRQDLTRRLEASKAPRPIAPAASPEIWMSYSLFGLRNETSILWCALHRRGRGRRNASGLDAEREAEEGASADRAGCLARSMGVLLSLRWRSTRCVGSEANEILEEPDAVTLQVRICGSPGGHSPAASRPKCGLTQNTTSFPRNVFSISGNFVCDSRG